MESIIKAIIRRLGKSITRDKIDKLSLQEAQQVIDPNQQFEYVLKAPKFTLIAILISFFLLFGGVTIALVLMIRNGSEFNADSIGGLSVLGGSALLLIPFYINQKGKYVALSNSLIEGNSPFSKQIEFRWTEITRVEFIQNKIINIYAGKQKVTIFKAYTGSIIALRLIHDKLDKQLYINSLLANESFMKLFNMYSSNEKETY